MFAKILIPTDLSEQSERIVARVGRMKNVREIILLHILDSNQHGRDRKDSGDVSGSAVRTAREKLNHQRGLIRDRKITVRLIIQENSGESIPEAILKTAETERPSLIVMGARKGLLSGSLLGEGSTAVLSSGRTHILVMRFPDGVSSPLPLRKIQRGISAQRFFSRSIFRNPQKVPCPILRCSTALLR